MLRSQQTEKRPRRMPLPPTPDIQEAKASNVELPVAIWEELDRVTASEEKRQGRYVARKEVIAFFLDWAIKDYWKELRRVEEKEKPKK